MSGSKAVRRRGVMVYSSSPRKEEAAKAILCSRKPRVSRGVYERKIGLRMNFSSHPNILLLPVKRGVVHSIPVKKAGRRGQGEDSHPSNPRLSETWR